MKKSRVVQVYKQLYRPAHPKASVTGMVAEHIILTEQELGRALEKGELVHHCDFDRLNNKASNRLPMTRLHHQQLPAFQARFIIKMGLYNKFLTWWKEVRDVVDPMHELKNELTRAENDKRRLEGKLYTQERIKNDHEE